MKLVTALKLGPRSIPIVGDQFEANRARNGAKAFSTAVTITNVAIAVVNHQVIVIITP